MPRSMHFSHARMHDRTTTIMKQQTLAGWVRGQRKLYRKVGRDGFPPSWLAKLEGLGFDFDPMLSGSANAKRRAKNFPQINANWTKYYMDLRSVIRENADVADSKIEYSAALKNWVRRQRKEYRKYLAGTQTAQMHDEWIEKLNEVGFVWEPAHRLEYYRVVEESR